MWWKSKVGALAIAIYLALFIISLLSIPHLIDDPKSALVWRDLITLPSLIFISVDGVAVYVCRVICNVVLMYLAVAYLHARLRD